MANITIDGVRMTSEAAKLVEWASVDVAADVARMRAGLTSEALLGECLDGAADEHYADWREYVAAVVAAAAVEE